MSFYHALHHHLSLEPYIQINYFGCYNIVIKREKPWSDGLQHEDWLWLKTYLIEHYPEDAKTIYAPLYQSLCFHIIMFHLSLEHYEEYVFMWIAQHDDAGFWCAFVDAALSQKTRMMPLLSNLVLVPHLDEKIHDIAHFTHNFERYGDRWSRAKTMV